MTAASKRYVAETAIILGRLLRRGVSTFQILLLRVFDRSLSLMACRRFSSCLYTKRTAIGPFSGREDNTLSGVSITYVCTSRVRDVTLQNVPSSLLFREQNSERIPNRSKRGRAIYTYLAPLCTHCSILYYISCSRTHMCALCPNLSILPIIIASYIHVHGVMQLVQTRHS